MPDAGDGITASALRTGLRGTAPLPSLPLLSGKTIEPSERARLRLRWHHVAEGLRPFHYRHVTSR
jgi:hypothetical protein